MLLLLFLKKFLQYSSRIVVANFFFTFPTQPKSLTSSPHMTHNSQGLKYLDISLIYPRYIQYPWISIQNSGKHIRQSIFSNILLIFYHFFFIFFLFQSIFLDILPIFNWFFDFSRNYLFSNIAQTSHIAH